MITTNGFVTKDGRAVMGRGCALEAKTKFEGIDFALGRLIKDHGNRCHILGDYGLVSFPVKHHWKEQADLDLIIRSAHELVQLADAHGWQFVVMPRPGCGNGKLKWADVKPAIAGILDDRFRVITN